MADTPRNKQKPMLTPPQGKLPEKASNPLVIILILLCLVILILLSGIVIWLLPSKTPLVPEQKVPVQTTVFEQNETGETSTNSKAAEAEQVLEIWLKSLAEAEAENIQEWGGEEYAHINAVAARGDQLFQDKEFVSAQAAYNEAVANLDLLMGSMEQKLEDAIDKGYQALELQDGQKSLLAFQLALSLDPHNEAALHGINRANNLDQVLILYNNGLLRVKEKDLEQAQKLFMQAINIDKDFTHAVNELKKVNKKILDIRFQDAMSRAITALDNEQIIVAKQALDEAAQIRPDDPAVVVARQTSSELEKVLKIKQLQMKSEQFERTEDWEALVATYRQALQVDNMVSFAIIGLPEAEKRVQLDKSLKSIIARPDRLQDEGPLQEARQVLKNAQRIENPGKILQSQVHSVEVLVKNASASVQVIFRSNSATEVEIYHIGRFRPFIEKPVILKPGIYTVVGRRPGFKDVRLSITITAEMKKAVFDIRCEEPI